MKNIKGKIVEFTGIRIHSGNPVKGKVTDQDKEGITVEVAHEVGGINTIWCKGTEKEFPFWLIKNGFDGIKILMILCFFLCSCAVLQPRTPTYIYSYRSITGSGAVFYSNVPYAPGDTIVELPSKKMIIITDVKFYKENHFKKP